MILFILFYFGWSLLIYSTLFSTILAYNQKTSYADELKIPTPEEWRSGTENALYIAAVWEFPLISMVKSRTIETRVDNLAHHSEVTSHPPSHHSQNSLMFAEAGLGILLGNVSVFFICAVLTATYPLNRPGQIFHCIGMTLPFFLSSAAAAAAAASSFSVCLCLNTYKYVLIQTRKLTN